MDRSGAPRGHRARRLDAPPTCPTWKCAIAARKGSGASPSPRRRPGPSGCRGF